MKIKASSINNLTDARYFAAWNVQWLGFCLQAGHPDYIPPKDIKEIKDWLVGPQIVGEFGVGQSANDIQTSIELLQLDAVQLSMFMDDTIAQAITNVPVIKEWVAESLDDISTFEAKCTTLQDDADYFLLNLEKNGITWQAVQADAAALQKIKDLCQAYAILISIACPPKELKAMIDQLKPHGLSVQGGEEEKVGVKSFDDLDEIYDALEEWDLVGF